jgi:hypothetical protein
MEKFRRQFRQHLVSWLIPHGLSWTTRAGGMNGTV